MGKENIITVGELTQYIRYLLEQDPKLRNVRVRGEISNLTLHQSSGHWYFTLKDQDSQISCAMFKGSQRNTGGYIPKHGDEVIVTGNLSVYPPRGGYQLIVQEMSPAGAGDLHQQFLLLKTRLQAEGLFEPWHKKAIPAFPRVVGLVTSLTGAVLQDIRNTLQRRWPSVELHVVPARMQGEGSADSVMTAMDLIVQTSHPDVLIIARGGGSMEDLWPFNDERLARKVFECPTPIISAIGHETDFTILDFVADLRAPTPTAAAELAVPNRADYISTLRQAELIIRRETEQFTNLRRQTLDDYSQRIQNNMLYRIEQDKNKLRILEARLQEMDIRKIMSRGFSVVLKNGKRITQAEELKTEDRLKLILYSGSAEVQVESTQTEKS